MAKERIDTYPEAARAIALWLDEFCDKSLRYPEMIADAARRAAKEIELLRCESPNNAIHADGGNNVLLESIAYYMEYVDSETVIFTRRR